MGTLERATWRQEVHARDGYACVLCGRPGYDPHDRPGPGVALDAHHLLERKLFAPTDAIPGGYDVNNGVSLCNARPEGGGPSCHEQAEYTTVGVEELRSRAGITRVVLPDALRAGHYDKWGNRLRDDGLREPGPLFSDTGCHRALLRGGVLGLFVHVFE